MAGQPIRRERFHILDKLGLKEVARCYLEDVENIPALVQKLFPVMGDGKRAGATLFYEWLDFRGYREKWKRLVALKRELRESEKWESVPLDSPEWPQND